jgi:hypothetical protein
MRWEETGRGAHRTAEARASLLMGLGRPPQLRLTMGKEEGGSVRRRLRVLI